MPHNRAVETGPSRLRGGLEQWRLEAEASQRSLELTRSDRSHQRVLPYEY